MCFYILDTGLGQRHHTPWIMASMSLSLSHASFLHQNPSLSSKPHQIPRLPLTLRNQPSPSLSTSFSPSSFFPLLISLLILVFSNFDEKILIFIAGLRVLAKRGNGVVPKATAGVLEANSNSPISAKKSTNPIVVIDNYDSFTYNLCQVHSFAICVVSC